MPLTSFVDEVFGYLVLSGVEGFLDGFSGADGDFVFAGAAAEDEGEADFGGWLDQKPLSREGGEQKLSRGPQRVPFCDEGFHDSGHI